MNNLDRSLLMKFTSDENYDINIKLLSTDIFSLDNSTGILRLQSNISNFANESMAVNIMARDNGNPSLSVSAFLRIYFANILKSAPIFESPLIKTSINEVSFLHVFVIFLLFDSKL